MAPTPEDIATAIAQLQAEFSRPEFVAALTKVMNEPLPGEEPWLVRAVCACGYTTEDPTALELWNGYGDHVDGDSTSTEHKVTVWTLSDGTINVVDNRDEDR